MEQFKQELLELLQKILGDEYVLDIMLVTKANDTRLEALTVRKSSNSCAINIYLQGYFSQYQDGREMEYIIADILNTIKKEKANTELINSNFCPLEKLSHYEDIKECLMLRAMNTDKNKEYLKNVVKESTGLDIDLYLYLNLHLFPNTSGYINVSRTLSDLWNVSDEELIHQAKENMQKYMPYEFTSMFQILMEAKHPLPENISGENMNLYFLTNQNRTFGASCLFYDGLLKKLSQDLDTLYFAILPSSIHETILLPVSSIDSEMNHFPSMVKDVNMNVLSSEEFLSDNVYYYDSNMDTIQIFEEMED